MKMHKTLSIVLAAGMAVSSTLAFAQGGPPPQGGPGRGDQGDRGDHKGPPPVTAARNTVRRKDTAHNTAAHRLAATQAPAPSKIRGNTRIGAKGTVSRSSIATVSMSSKIIATTTCNRPVVVINGLASAVTSCW